MCHIFLFLRFWLMSLLLPGISFCAFLLSIHLNHPLIPCLNVYFLSDRSSGFFQSQNCIILGLSVMEEKANKGGMGGKETNSCLTFGGRKIISHQSSELVNSLVSLLMFLCNFCTATKHIIKIIYTRG